jgi:hypothetical protein
MVIAIVSQFTFRFRLAYVLSKLSGLEAAGLAFRSIPQILSTYSVLPLNGTALHACEGHPHAENHVAGGRNPDPSLNTDLACAWPSRLAYNRSKLRRT